MRAGGRAPPRDWSSAGIMWGARGQGAASGRSPSVRPFAEAPHAETACLLVPAPDDGRLTVAYMWGSDGQPAPAPAWLHDWLKGGETPTLVAANGSAPPGLQRGPGLVYPLTGDDRLVAVLAARRERPPFGSGDLERAGVFAMHARIALQNERLL